MEVSCVLAEWYQENKRNLPWRNSFSPYFIWLSEIILQQTRVNQGIGYYSRFIHRFPSIHDLAAATDDEVLKLWQGLGYYTRARNLLETARYIVNELDGKFPDTYESLLRLKGVGTYTAAAIASMAFNQPVALVDGNVYRVISRLFASGLPIDSTEGRLWFSKKALELLDPLNPGTHNQAMMEFGALVCLPKNPRCNICVLSAMCQARVKNMTGELPVKKQKGKARIRYFNYLVADYNGKTLLKKRNGKDIWHSLYEFPMVESSDPPNFNDLISHPSWRSLFDHIAEVHEGVMKYEHRLTHQTLVCSFTRVRLNNEPQNHEYILADKNDLDSYAVPRVIERFLADVKQ